MEDFHIRSFNALMEGLKFYLFKYSIISKENGLKLLNKDIK